MCSRIDAIEEVNRYSHRKVRLGDPALSDLRVSGNFIVGDGAQIVQAFAAVLPLRSVDIGGGEIVVFLRYEPRSIDATN